MSAAIERTVLLLHRLAWLTAKATATGWMEPQETREAEAIRAELGSAPDLLRAK